MTNEILCIIILIIACVITLLALWYKIQKDGLRETVIKLIVIAENNFGSGEGKKKMEMVVSNIHKVLPTPLRLFLSEDMIINFVQTIFNEVKEALEYGNK